MNKQNITELLPHRGKMLLIDRIIRWGREKDGNPPFVHTETAITEKNVFFDAELGGVPSFTGFELMAQSAAALSRLLAPSDEPPSLGVIASVSKLSAPLPVFPKGRTVRTEVTQDFAAGGTVMLSGRCIVIFADGTEQCAVQARLTAVRGNIL